MPEGVVGYNYKSKIDKVVAFLKKRRSDYLFITASENNAWLLNIRGRDTKYTPIPYSYVLIDKNRNIKLFCDLKKISSPFKKQFKKIDVIDKNLIERILSRIINKKFIIDKNSCSIFFENMISKNNKILNADDPIYLLKAIKNYKEIKNIKKAHIDDGVALTKYLFWLKENFRKKRSLK